MSRLRLLLSRWSASAAVLLTLRTRPNPPPSIAQQEGFKQAVVASGGFSYRPEHPDATTFKAQKWAWASSTPGRGCCTALRALRCHCPPLTAAGCWAVRRMDVSATMAACRWLQGIGRRWSLTAGRLHTAAAAPMQRQRQERQQQEQAAMENQGSHLPPCSSTTCGATAAAWAPRSCPACAAAPAPARAWMAPGRCRRRCSRCISSR